MHFVMRIGIRIRIEISCPSTSLEKSSRKYRTEERKINGVVDMTEFERR